MGRHRYDLVLNSSLRIPCLTIVTPTDLPKLKSLILATDPDALVVVNDTMEVLGKKHGVVPTY